jgi:hypothetical protein
LGLASLIPADDQRYPSTNPWHNLAYRGIEDRVVYRQRRLVHTQETMVRLRPGLLLSEILNQTQTYMKDDKRFLRRLKRDIKRVGNRQRRRYLKDVDADTRDFDFGRN